MLWNHTLRLIFKFLIRTIISDENLISLLKGWIETVLAPHNAFVHFRVHSWRSLSYFVISSDVHDFTPEVVVVWIPWYFKYWFLVVLDFFLKLFSQLLSDFYLRLWIHGYGTLAWRLAVLGITWSSRGRAIICNYVLGVTDHRYFAKY